ncbi:MAG: glycosyltransferase [Clostridia bacterium]|nr:glycosyltransferase [Clostridia bacterium]
MKKILVYGMTDNPGGIETYLINLSERLKGRIIFDYVTDFPEIAHKDIIASAGSKVFYIPPKGKKLFSHLLAFYNILRKHPEYNTVYFNVLDAGCAITELVPFVMGRRIITHSHNSDTDKPRLHKLCKPLLKIISRNNIACSHLAADYMFGKRKNVTVIPNAIDTEKFRFNAIKREEKRKELGVGNAPVICHIGRLSYQKNPFGMLDIFGEVLKICPEARLLSVGTGEIEGEVHCYAEKIGVGKSVLLLGKRQDIPELLMAADVFFLPSFYEGLPIVAVEAQAAGLKCVLSDSITGEVDLTGDILFLSLSDTKEKWANAILSAAKEGHNDNTEEIKSAGYDLKSCEKSDLRLLEILKGK